MLAATLSPLSLSSSPRFPVPRVSLSLRFNVPLSPSCPSSIFPPARVIHLTLSFTLFTPFSFSSYLSLSTRADIFLLCPRYGTFAIIPPASSLPSPFFFPAFSFSLFSSLSARRADRIFSFPYFSYPRAPSRDHSLTHFLRRSPSPAHQRRTFTHSAFFLVRLLTRSVSFIPFLSSSDTQGRDLTLSLRRNLPPHYCALPSRNRAENLRTEPSRAVSKCDREGRRYRKEYCAREGHSEELTERERFSGATRNHRESNVARVEGRGDGRERERLRSQGRSKLSKPVAFFPCRFFYSFGL